MSIVRPLIIETDLGRDPDDLFAILYLAATQKYDIKAVCITPGDWDQVCLAAFIRAQCGLDFEIGIPTKSFQRDKTSSGGVHYALMNKYRWPILPIPAEAKLGADLIKKHIGVDTQFFSIGPMTNIKEYLWGRDHQIPMQNRLTVQGGFCPYSIHEPEVTLDKFKDKTSVPTFNFNGDRPGAQLVVDTFEYANFIGKNVCHTVEFDSSRAPKKGDRTETLEVKSGPQPHRARWLFEDAAELYFKKHKSKKFHDPTAAVAMVHSKVATWKALSPVKQDAGWTSERKYNKQSVAVDIDYDQLWKHIGEFN
jgi:inosine-uridine nucleoside N-ribohydrolase